jgi:hypothetical protein
LAFLWLGFVAFLPKGLHPRAVHADAAYRTGACASRRQQFIGGKWGALLASRTLLDVAPAQADSHFGVVFIAEDAQATQS